jgi:hypothetical protein
MRQNVSAKILKFYYTVTSQNILLFNKIYDGAGYWSGNDPNLCSATARSGCRLFRLRSFVIFRGHSREIPRQYFDYTTTKLFSFNYLISPNIRQFFFQILLLRKGGSALFSGP